MMGLNVGKFPSDYLLKPGEYGIAIDGEWYACTPNGYTAGLGNHEVTLHPDSTITVSPSILVSADMTGSGVKELWHGFLKAGVWASC